MLRRALKWIVLSALAVVGPVFTYMVYEWATRSVPRALAHATVIVENSCAGFDAQQFDPPRLDRAEATYYVFRWDSKAGAGPVTALVQYFPLNTEVWCSDGG